MVHAVRGEENRAGLDAGFPVADVADQVVEVGEVLAAVAGFFPQSPSQVRPAPAGCDPGRSQVLRPRRQRPVGSHPLTVRRTRVSASNYPAVRFCPLPGHARQRSTRPCQQARSHEFRCRRAPVSLLDRRPGPGEGENLPALGGLTFTQRRGRSHDA